MPPRNPNGYNLSQVPRLRLRRIEALPYRYLLVRREDAQNWVTSLGYKTGDTQTLRFIWLLERFIYTVKTGLTILSFQPQNHKMFLFFSPISFWEQRKLAISLQYTNGENVHCSSSSGCNPLIKSSSGLKCRGLMLRCHSACASEVTSYTLD